MKGVLQVKFGVKEMMIVFCQNTSDFDTGFREKVILKNAGGNTITIEGNR